MSQKEYILNEFGDRLGFNQFTIEDIDDSYLDYLPENLEKDEPEDNDYYSHFN